MKQLFAALIFSIAGCLALTGCAYKIDVQQGNIITNKDVKAIHRGMSINHVKDMLGTPLLVNIYKDNRIVYVYTMKRGHRAMTRRNLTIHFIDGKVTYIRTQLAN